MAPLRIDYRRVKVHRTYTVREVAHVAGVHPNAVRAWLKNGLEAIDDRRPKLIHGRALRSFLKARRAAAKRPCPPGTLYCLKCRTPRVPVLGMVEFIPDGFRAGNLCALCEACGTMMHRRAKRSMIDTILPNTDVRIVDAESRIAECRKPSLKCA